MSSKHLLISRGFFLCEEKPFVTSSFLPRWDTGEEYNKGSGGNYLATKRHFQRTEVS